MIFQPEKMLKNNLVSYEPIFALRAIFIFLCIHVVYSTSPLAGLSLAGLLRGQWKFIHFLLKWKLRQRIKTTNKLMSNISSNAGPSNCFLFKKSLVQAFLCQSSIICMLSFINLSSTRITTVEISLFSQLIYIYN